MFLRQEIKGIKLNWHRQTPWEMGKKRRTMEASRVWGILSMRTKPSAMKPLLRMSSPRRLRRTSRTILWGRRAMVWIIRGRVSTRFTRRVVRSIRINYKAVSTQWTDILRKAVMNETTSAPKLWQITAIMMPLIPPPRWQTCRGRSKPRPEPKSARTISAPWALITTRLANR